MKSLKIPGYIYQNGNQKAAGELLIYQDTEFVEQFSAYTTDTRIQQWSDMHAVNMAELVNKFLGHNVINTGRNFYLGMSSTDTFPASWGNAMLSKFPANITYVTGMTRDNNTSSFQNCYFKTLNNNQTTTGSDTVGYMFYSGTPEVPAVIHAYSANDSVAYINFDVRDKTMSFTIYIFREDLFTDSGALGTGDALHAIQLTFYATLNNDMTEVKSGSVWVQYHASNFADWFRAGWTTPFSLDGAQAETGDPDDPYENGNGDGNDGGDGEYPPGIIEGADVPPLPNVSAANCGLVTIYNPSLAQMQSLGSYLWSNMFDLDTFKKLFTDPMDAIVGLAIVPAVPSSGGSKNIKFGNVDSGINCSYLATQFVSVDMGSVRIKKDIGSFLDYTATKISIYLPYLGFRDLSPDDVMGDNIKVVYNIDVLTGACAAFIKTSKRGVLYAYNGSCITNVAVTGQNFSGAIQNAVSTVASGAGVIAGMATGAAPVTAMSAISMLKSAANTAFNSKPDIQRSGNLGGSAGILSVQKPFIVIQRPEYDPPSNLASYVGNTTFKTVTLGSCSGFTMVDEVHLDGFAATQAEKAEIESMLKGGVIL